MHCLHLLWGHVQHLHKHDCPGQCHEPWYMWYDHFHFPNSPVFFSHVRGCDSHVGGVVVDFVSRTNIISLTSACVDTVSVPVLQTRRGSNAPALAVAVMATNVARRAVKHVPVAQHLAVGLARASHAESHVHHILATAAAVDLCRICCARYPARSATRLFGPFRTRNKETPTCTIQS